MAIRTWISGTVGSWFNASNWTTAPPDPNNYPQPGDTAIIRDGTATALSSVIANEDIVLGGPDDTSPATLEATSTVFGPDVNLSVVGPGTGQASEATILSHGSTTYEGRISVVAKGGDLAIDAESDGSSADFTLEDAPSGTASLLLVNQEASLHLEGQKITNDATIQVEGAGDVAAGLTLDGDGIVELDAGGRLSVEGSVESTQHIDFADGTGKLTIADAANFHGEIGLPTTATGDAGFELGGARIDLTGVQAESTSYSDGVLTLYSGLNQTGSVVAQLNTDLIFWEDLEPLPPVDQTLTAADFSLSADGTGGTLLTFTPQGSQVVNTSLPISITAPTGSKVSLASILQQSFGTATPLFYSIELVPSPPLGDSPTDPPYWGQPQVQSAWFVNGHQITGPTTVTAADDVQLLVGNNMYDPVQLRAQVTPSSTGPSSEYVLYNVWTTPPAVAQAVQASGYTAGAPTAANIITSAVSFAAAFAGQLDYNLCNWIADSVAAGAGAPMPLPNADIDPSVNAEGGFWRIVYRGDGADPVQNWSTLVQPGDIVRMEWFNTGGHTTTVLGSVNANGDILVYDNVDHNSQDQETIGIHTADYWTGTDPAGITIYRLDPSHQYLIDGTPLAEVIQGSAFNNLIRPDGGADIIACGPGDSEIQGTTADLNTITVTDFKAGDTLDFTDLDPTLVKLSFAGGVLTASDGAHLARLTLNGLTNPNFVVTPDGKGGAVVALSSGADVPPSGGGSGDVHMVCFDGLHYDFQAVGDFVAVQSSQPDNPWQIQIRTASYPDATSVTTEVAVQLGGSRVTFGVGRDNIVQIEGVPDATLRVGAVQPLAGGMLTELSAISWRLTWSTGETLTVTDTGGYLDWTVGLGPHDGAGSVRGLLGGDSGPATDFELPNGSILAQPSNEDILGPFADAWRVAPGASLLDDTSAPAAAALAAATTPRALSNAIAGALVPPHAALFAI